MKRNLCANNNLDCSFDSCTSCISFKEIKPACSQAEQPGQPSVPEDQKHLGQKIQIEKDKISDLNNSITDLKKIIHSHQNTLLSLQDEKIFSINRLKKYDRELAMLDGRYKDCTIKHKTATSSRPCSTKDLDNFITSLSDFQKASIVSMLKQQFDL